MTPDTIDAALPKHLDEMRSIVKWVISFAFVASILVIQGRAEMEALGVELSRNEAFFIIAVIYIALCVAVAGHAQQIATLLRGVPVERLSASTERLASHEWLFNPYAFYWNGGEYFRPGYWGFVALIATFWLCMACLYALVPGFLDTLVFEPRTDSFFDTMTWSEAVKGVGYAVPVGAFAAIGDLAMKRIIGTYKACAARCVPAEPLLAARFEKVQADLTAASHTGIATGGVVFIAVLALAYALPRYVL